MTIVGLATSAIISALSQSGSIAFSVYLPLSMTISMVICGQLLRSYNAWLERQTARQQGNPYWAHLART